MTPQVRLYTYNAYLRETGWQRQSTCTPESQSEIRCNAELEAILAGFRWFRMIRSAVADRSIAPEIALREASLDAPGAWRSAHFLTVFLFSWKDAKTMRSEQEVRRAFAPSAGGRG